MYQVLVDDMKKKQNSENKDTSPNMSQNSVELALSHAHLLKRLSGLLAVSEKERSSLLREASDRVKKIGSENIVMNPRGAFIGRSESNTRLTNTLLFVEGVTELGGTLLTEDRPLLDQMSRWIMSEKKSDGSWGSTLDTTHVIRAITAIERTT